MSVSQSAMRRLASSVLLAFGLAACSHDEGPSPFDPDGTSADLAGAQMAFDSPVAASFEAAGAADLWDARRCGGGGDLPCDALLHPATARGYAASVADFAAHRTPSSALRSSRFLRRLSVSRSRGIARQQRLRRIRCAGRARERRSILLYAINPVTRQPAEPLDELGYVDVTDVSAGAVLGTRVSSSRRMSATSTTP